MDGGLWQSFSTNSEGRCGKGLLRKPTRFHCKFSEECLFCGFAASAGARLFFVADEDLQAATSEKTSEDGGTGLAALLGLIVDGNAAASEKTSEGGLLPAEIPQEGTLVIRRQRSVESARRS